jgi:DNA-binding PadR family transcriptional regulator
VLELSLGEFGRFSEPAVQVLVSLASTSKHGYLIADEIEARTGRRPQPATLYGVLSRLEERGWIERLRSDGRRTPFRITSAGERVLEARLAELDALVRAGRHGLRAAAAP